MNTKDLYDDIDISLTTAPDKLCVTRVLILLYFLIDSALIALPTSLLRLSGIKWFKDEGSIYTFDNKKPYYKKRIRDNAYRVVHYVLYFLPIILGVVFYVSK